MTKKPLLKQYGDLIPSDFVDHPIWIACHSVDYDEKWYDDTDEETFRPWTGETPVDAEEMYLVSCTLTLADGRKFSGFVTPAFEEDDLGTMQPQLFDERGRRHGFLMGMFPSEDAMKQTVGEFGASGMFPIRFAAESELSSSPSSGTIRGFYKFGRNGPEIIE